MVQRVLLAPTKLNLSRLRRALDELFCLGYLCILRRALDEHVANHAAGLMSFSDLETLASYPERLMSFLAWET